MGNAQCSDGLHTHLSRRGWLPIQQILDVSAYVQRNVCSIRRDIDSVERDIDSVKRHTYIVSVKRDIDSVKRDIYSF